MIFNNLPVLKGLSDKVGDFVASSAQNLVSGIKNRVSEVKDTLYDVLGVGNSGDDSQSSWNFSDYLTGLATSQGEENIENRDYNSAQAALNRQFQSDEARIQRDWYEAMSNSSYQRAVSDMKAAGLNPALAYSQGGAASSGTGIAAGSAASYNATGGDTLSDILSAMADVVYSVSGASSRKISDAFKIFRMAGG